MNIFILHEDPIIAATMQCDKHVVKMIVESAQILSTVYNRYSLPAPYKPTHAKHPCVLWAGDYTDNYNWLVIHAIALCKEYTKRYKKIHKCEQVIRSLAHHPDDMPIGYSDFVQCMPDQYKQHNAIVAYREYYHSKPFCTWKYTKAPSWWNPKPILTESELLFNVEI